MAAELSLRGEPPLRTGSTRAVAFAGSRLVVRGAQDAVLSVSVTDASALADRVTTLSGFEVVVSRGGRSLASTLPSPVRADALPAGVLANLDVGGEDYRGKFVSMEAPAGPPVRLGVLTPTASFSEHIANNRLLIALLVGLFVLLALVSAGFVSRALTGQIATFLVAARRLSRGDFQRLVPLQGATSSPSSAASSTTCRSSSRRRWRRSSTSARSSPRRFAALATRSPPASTATASWRWPCARPSMPATRRSAERSRSPAARSRVARSARWRALPERDRSGRARRLRDPLGGGAGVARALEGDEPGERTRRAVSAQGEGVHALSIGLRSLVEGPEYLGALSIARYGQPFSREEEDLLEYLAGQAVVSVENASLHEAVEQQAVTDELTGLANVRAFLAALDREVERGRRFDTPLGLIMLDLDDFKLVNDSYGHQQGDEVLALVAGVLRDEIRELDIAARYGGEELAVILPQTDGSGAELLAERMRAAVESLQVPRVGGRGTERHCELRGGGDAGERAGPGWPDRGRRRGPLRGQAGGQEPRGARRDARG